MRILLLFSAALIAAVSTTYAVVERLSEPSPSEHTAIQVSKPDIAMVDVLVAAQSLGAGTLLGPDDLRWQPWPEDNLGTTFITRPSANEPSGDDRIGDDRGLDQADPRQADPKSELLGSVVRQPIADATPIAATNLLQPGDRGFLAAVLSPGKRAISIAVDETTGLAGLVFPGDHVDLVMTHRAADAGGFGAWPGSRQASETVLSDIRILALDQRLESIDGVAQQARTATLEVSPQEAETIALARNMGDLTLTLNSARPDPAASDGGDFRYVSTLVDSTMQTRPALRDDTSMAALGPIGFSSLSNGQSNGANSTSRDTEESSSETVAPFRATDDVGRAPSFTLDTEISRVLGNLMRQATEAQEEASTESETEITPPPLIGEAESAPEIEANQEKTVQNLQVVRGSSSEMLTFGDDRPAESNPGSASGGPTTSAASLGQSAAGMAGGL